MKTLAIGSIIGILGGGQLARMTALAAAKLGYRCHIFCSDPTEPAVAVSTYTTIGHFDDNAALEKFARAVDVVTLEWENVPLQSLQIIAAYAPLHPSANVLRVAQDRGLEKEFARKVGGATTDFVIVHSAKDLALALQTFPIPAILKSTRMGYDGKGQVTITQDMSADEAWALMGSDIGILEAFVDFACEVSVLVAARADGAMVTYPVVENIHRDHILRETHAPANIDAKAAQEAEHMARVMAEKLGLIGLLAVEFFVLRENKGAGHRVLINEIAPRPHNSGHWTIDGCVVDQFEQLVRAVCGLPLGDPYPHNRAIMHNLIGSDIERASELLKQPGASLHLYGKSQTRAGRKMGHVTFLKGPW